MDNEITATVLKVGKAGLELFMPSGASVLFAQRETYNENYDEAFEWFYSPDSNDVRPGVYCFIGDKLNTR